MRYRHYKGNVYTFLYAAKHTESGEHLVIYMDEFGLVWARPYAMFHGLTEDGVKRFVLLNDAIEDFDSEYKATEAHIKANNERMENKEWKILR